MTRRMRPIAHQTVFGISGEALQTYRQSLLAAQLNSAPDGLMATIWPPMAKSLTIRVFVRILKLPNAGESA